MVYNIILFQIYNIIIDIFMDHITFKVIINNGCIFLCYIIYPSSLFILCIVVYIFYFFLFFFFFFLFFFFFYLWWILSYIEMKQPRVYMCSPSQSPLPPPSPPIPSRFSSAPGPSACLMHPTWAGDLFHPR